MNRNKNNKNTIWIDICTKSVGLILVLFAAAALILNVFQVEKQVMYKPTDDYKEPPIEIANKLELSEFLNNKNQHLKMFHIKGIKKSPAILFAHGNSWNATHFFKKVSFLAQKGYNIYLFDYRGFGKSEGKPNEKGLYQDLEAAVKNLQDLGISKDNIILWGHSLGGAIVVDIASRFDFKGVILEGTFTSMEDMRKFVTSQPINGKGFLIFRNIAYNLMILTQKYDTKSKIGKITSPLLIVHSEEDETVPCFMAKELRKLNPNAKIFISKNGKHSEVGWQNDKIFKFIKSLSK